MSRKQIVKKQNRNKAITKCVFFISVIFVMSLSILLLKEPEKKYNIELIGDKKEYLSVNSDYKDKGFSLKIGEEEINKDDVIYDVEDNINKNVLGKYEVNYKIRYDNKEYKLKREVDVVDDIKPVITGIDDEIEIYYCNKDEKLNLNYIAEDNYDGIITDKVKVDREKDTVTLSVMDSSGNIEIKTVRLKFSEEKVPNIELIGNDLIYIKLGNKYKEKGAHATNGCGKEIDDANIEITGNVDTNKVGEYTITYTVKSESGLKATKTRKVVVYDQNNPEINVTDKKKVIYLTFDDGPGMYTNKLLDILKQYDVKVTFFVTNQFKKYVPLIEREHNEGHAIGVHSLTHKWSIYKSVETYVKDFNDMNNIISKYTGNTVDIFRFPGGSSNTISKSYASGVVKAIQNKMTEYGYVYFDWNVDSEDAAGANTNKIIKNVIKGIETHDYSVVLMHDIKKKTVDGIEEIINYALANGYTFETLNLKSPTVHHHIAN